MDNQGGRLLTAVAAPGLPTGTVFLSLPLHYIIGSGAITIQTPHDPGRIRIVGAFFTKCSFSHNSIFTFAVYDKGVEKSYLYPPQEEWGSPSHQTEAGASSASVFYCAIKSCGSCIALFAIAMGRPAILHPLFQKEGCDRNAADTKFFLPRPGPCPMPSTLCREALTFPWPLFYDGDTDA